MRLTTVILIASLMQVSAATFGQRVTLNKANASLFSVLKDIRKQTGYGFYYDPATISQNQKVSVSVSNATIEEALSDALKGLDLAYTIDGKIVTIKAKENPSFLENVIARFQEIDVSGRVVDADGRGLPGASVSVKGKGKAVSTGADGSFYLKGVDEEAVLVISFIGYVNKEVKAVKELGDVVLELSTSKLDEVQVIAYGTTTQRLSTGNVTTIKADVIEKQPVNNPLLALQGRVPGLFIEQATGFAGTGVKVRIQGQNSLNYGSDPLYVIDGIPYSSQLLPGGNSVLGGSGGSRGTGTSGISFGNPLSFINPAEIESIDVLKDADATSIYGSRAANGAILITTKKGKTGDTKLNLNLQSGFAKVPEKLNLLNSEQFLEMRKEALKNDGISEPRSGPYGDNELNGNWDNTRNTDWQKELIGKIATYNDLQASVSGGDERTTFLIGAGYHKETNVFPGDFSDKKTSLHFNINNSSANQKFKIQLSGSYLNDNNQLPNVDLTLYAMSLAPIAPNVYNSDGSINWAPDANGTSTFIMNPMGYLYDSFQSKASNLISNMVLKYNFLPGLAIQSSFGYNNLSTNDLSKKLLQSTAPEDLPYTSRNSIFTNSKINSWSIEPQITFNRNINNGKLEVLLGGTILQQNSDQTGMIGIGFSNDLVMDDILSAPTFQGLTSINTVYKYNALFGRVNYNWGDKYIVNLTARRDGSSRFGAENKFHNFGAIGAAWIFTEEHIFKEYLEFLSFGKLRTSFGTTGNDQIPDYQYLSLYDPRQQDVPYQGIVTYQPNRLTNPYLQWEETKKLQFGLDLGFLQDRFLLNVTYNRNLSSNQLSSYVLSGLTGFPNIFRNLNSTIENSGWELMFSSRNLKYKDFSWSTSINLTVPKTILKAYPDLEKTPEATTAIVGESLGAIKLYHFLGVDPATGMYQFADKNGDPTVSPNDPEDRTVIVDPFPRFYGGFQNTISYKGFQLDILFQFTKQIAQSDILFGAFDNRAPGNYGYGQGNQTTTVLNRWKKPGDVVTRQRFTTTWDLNQSLSNAYSSDAAWEDASFIRLKNISLSWNLPEKWIKTAHLNSCNLFLQGQNLWTLTNYTGLDPETKSSMSLPVLKVITMGVKVGL